MSTNHKPLPDEVEHLLRNAQLRDELEPYFDESIRNVNVEELPTPVENEFLASMLAWERAPILPICQWFEPPLILPHPDTLDEARLHALLWDTIHKLFARRQSICLCVRYAQQDLLLQPGHAYHKELVHVAGEDGQELDAFKQWMVGIAFLKHTPVEFNVA